MKGRGNSHVATTSGAMRLEINNLIKNKSLVKGKAINFISSWTNGSKISIKSVYSDTEIYIQLKYNQTDRTTKEIKNYDYKIYIGKVKSNLGKGYNLYFYCPESALRCKILYLCYGSERFKSRLAYNNRIYYHEQTNSKENRLNGRSQLLETTIDKLRKKRKTKNYNGKPTKRNLRMCKLLNKKAEVDKLNDAQFEKWLYKKIGV